MSQLRNGWMLGYATSNNLKLAALWKIRRTDNVVYRFTDHNCRIYYDDGETGLELYSPVEGFHSSAYRKEAGIKSGNVDFQGILSSDYISDKDLYLGKFRNARVDEYIVNWLHPWAGCFEHNRFWIISTIRKGTKTEDEGWWEAETGGYGHWLRQKVGKTYNRRCPYIVGDAFCTYAGSLKTFYGIIALPGDDDRMVFQINSNMESGWWNDGLVEWITGKNAATGIKSTIVKSELAGSWQTNITLATPSLYPALVGDTLWVYVPCQKTIEHCYTYFQNEINFGGQPHLPGQTRMMEMPDSKL